MRIIQIIFVSVFLLINHGCKEPNNRNQSGLSLMKYGIPVTLNVSQDAVVSQSSAGNLGVDVSVKYGDDFNMHIFMTNAVSSNVAAVKQRLKEDAIANPYFIKMLEEFDDGFIFEKNSVNSFDKRYDFRRIKIQGDKEIIFQTGVTGEYDEKAIKKMYNAIR